MEEYRHFTAIIAGNNPQEIMTKYDKRTLLKEPVLAFEFDKAKEYFDFKKYELEQLLAINSDDMTPQMKTLIQSELDYYQTIDEYDFYLELTEECDIDEETGDAYYKYNPDYKFDGCNIGGNFSIPFTTKNGTETYSTSKGNIDWHKMHGDDTETYKVVWETVMEGREPQNKDEEILYNNMKNRTTYLELFKTKENYIASNTAFWCYAYVDENGWHELNGEQFEWVVNFYDNFIKNLSDDTILTIYECVRK